MRSAVFLDRDGTIIELVHHLIDPRRVRVLPGAGKAIKSLRDAGYRCVVVTNQSVVGRGLLTEDGLTQIHDEMARQLAQEGAGIDRIYWCPVVPQGKDTTIIEHHNRKPGPGMLRQAAAELQLDLGASWMIGDSISDILAGSNAGCRGSILLSSEVPPVTVIGNVHVTHQAVDLASASQLILALDRAVPQ